MFDTSSDWPGGRALPEGVREGSDGSLGTMITLSTIVVILFLSRLLFPPQLPSVDYMLVAVKVKVRAASLYGSGSLRPHLQPQLGRRPFLCLWENNSETWQVTIMFALKTPHSVPSLCHKNIPAPVEGEGKKEWKV